MDMVHQTITWAVELSLLGHQIRDDLDNLDADAKHGWALWHKERHEERRGRREERCPQQCELLTWLQQQRLTDGHRGASRLPSPCGWGGEGH